MIALFVCGLTPTPSMQGDALAAPPFEASRLPGLETVCGSPDKDFILEVNGGGLVLGDFDGDGTCDLVVIDGSTLERVASGQAGRPPRLFTNGGAGELTPAGEGWELSGGRWGMGGSAADVDGDGWLDLVVTEWGRDRLVHNSAGAGFEEVVDSGFVGERWGTSAGFLDVDGDGFLDLAIANYLHFDPAEIATRASGACRWKGHAVLCGPEGLIPVHDQLYRNTGAGRFEDATIEFGFRPRTAGFGLGVMTFDADVDGDTDLYVTNDSTPNHLWENRRGSEDGPALVEVGLRTGASLDANGKEQAGMGIACGDWNGDGIADLFVSNFSGEANALYLSSGGMRYRERSAPARLAGPSIVRLGWGTAAEDFDLDGDLDLVVFNGHVYPQADAPGSDTSYAQPDFLHRFEPGPGGRPTFTTENLVAGAPVVDRAAAATDLDGDGWPDLVALELGGGVRVLRNRRALASGSAARHWAGFTLRAPGPNGAGLGARLEIEWKGGRATREIRTAGGFQSAVPAAAHVGLGAAERVARVVVHWPDGTRTSFADLAADRRHELVHPALRTEEGER